LREKHALFWVIFSLNKNKSPMGPEFKNTHHIQTIAFFSWFPYLIIFIILVCFSCIICLKLKYGFWYYQPVFHAYDFKYYLFPCGIIREKLPEKNRWTDFKHVQTLRFEDVSQLKIKRFVRFIQKHFFNNKNGNGNVFYPKVANIMPYFIGHNLPCFLSLYNSSQQFYDTAHCETITDDKLIGVMTSRPVFIQINANDGLSFDAYYVDYLCVDKNHRNSGIAPTIIQTHEYVQRHAIQTVSVSLFKREGVLTGIVPLTVYSSFCFNFSGEKMAINKHKIINKPSVCIEVGQQTIQFMWDFFKENAHLFNIMVSSSISNLLELIKTENIFAYIIVDTSCGNKILACYVFKRPCIYMKNEQEIITLVATIQGNLTDDVFLNGFWESYNQLIKKMHKKKILLNYLVIEDIGDNSVILSGVHTKKISVVVSPTAYFFYNYASPTFPSRRCFILC
jgi:hypothetical protein